ncbi:hypothetical protein GCK32_001720 [Trichostrongylus colubriformis]|uniref:Uncharacterized protein n=1 Tax=Trichostrongylus colubriformis TaxID=6319 RepID=A0AAN8FDF0_TRICO
MRLSVQVDPQGFLGMIPSPSSKERKLLKPHNPGTSPVKICQPPVRSPLVTPTKSYGDRFIPIRKPNQEWTTRYNAIVCPEQESPASFKRPAANRTPATTSNVTNNNSSPSSQYNQNQLPFGRGRLNRIIKKHVTDKTRYCGLSSLEGIYP